MSARNINSQNRQQGTGSARNANRTARQQGSGSASDSASRGQQQTYGSARYANALGRTRGDGLVQGVISQHRRQVGDASAASGQNSQASSWRQPFNPPRRNPQPAQTFPPVNFDWYSSVPAENRAEAVTALNQKVLPLVIFEVVSEYRKMASWPTRDDVAALPSALSGLSLRSGYDEERIYLAPTATNRKKCDFIVIDCEFFLGQDADGLCKVPMIGSIAAVDGITGEVLMNNLHVPHDKRSFNPQPRFSGISWQMINEATKAGTAFRTLDALHRRLANFIDENTIIGGHALHNDLFRLRLAHRRVIDTQLLYSGFNGIKFPGLSKLAFSKLHANIQIGKHDALEDACATRELILAKVWANWKPLLSAPIGHAETVKWMYSREDVNGNDTLGGGQEAVVLYDAELGQTFTADGVRIHDGIDEATLKAVFEDA